MVHVGLIGLGVMGRNLGLNLVDHGYILHVFNRTKAKTVEFQKVAPEIRGFVDFNEFVTSLSSPRKILLVVSAGTAVEEYLKRLDAVLDKEDIVIDCGNSDYADTIQRSKIFKFNFVGCGVSGGEKGARHGPSLMVGCTKDVYEQIGGILEDISAKHNSQPCCKRLGNDGAGHFVKVVHNGIEYCEMQLLQELLNVVRSRETARELFRAINNGPCQGYLTEICEKILKKENDQGLVLDQIVDKAEQKGTGKICVRSGIELDSDVSFMAQAVFSRYLSSKKERRVKFNEKLSKMAGCKELGLDSADGHSGSIDGQVSMETLERAFYLSKAICYIQGFQLLLNAKEIHSWEYMANDICDVWREGCILRCKFLDVVREMATHDNFELSDSFMSILEDGLPSLKEVCQFSVENGTYAPLFNNCLQWVYGMNMASKNGILLQAMRDYFGRHGIVLEGGEHLSVHWNSKTEQ